MVFIRAADYGNPEDDFECPDCKEKGEIFIGDRKDIRVRVWCERCGRVVADIDAAEWRGRYEPPM